MASINRNQLKGKKKNKREIEPVTIITKATDNGTTKSAYITTFGVIIAALIGAAVLLLQPAPSPNNIVNLKNAEAPQVAMKGDIYNINNVTQKEYDKLLSRANGTYLENPDNKKPSDELFKQLEIIKLHESTRTKNNNTLILDEIKDAWNKGDRQKAQELAETNVKLTRNSLAPSLYVSAFLKAKNLDMTKAYREIKEAIELEPNNTTYLTLISNISFHLRDISKSIIYQKRILKLALKAEPSSSSQIFIARFNLASILSFNNEFYEATYQLKELLKTVQENSVDETSVFLLLSEVYSKGNKTEKADHYLSKATDFLTNSNELNSETLALIYQKTARQFAINLQFDKAIKNLLIAIDIVEKQSNIKPKNTYKGYNSFAYITLLYRDLGASYFLNNEDSKAFEFTRKSLERTITTHGNKALLVSKDHHTLGNIYHSQGNYNKSLHHLKLTLTGYITHLNSDDPLFKLINRDIGKCLDMLGKHSDAITYYKKSITAFSKVKNKQEDDFLEIANMQQLTGNILIEENKVQEGINYYKLSLSTFESINKEDHEFYKLVQNNLATVQKSLSKEFTGSHVKPNTKPES